MVFSINPALTIHRWCRHTDAALPPLPVNRFTGGTQIDIFVLAITPCRPGEVRSYVLVDLRRLHHAQLLVVHHVTVHQEGAGVIEETRADDGAAAFGRPRHDHAIAPGPIGVRLTADLDALERVGMDMKNMVVMPVGVADRPFLHRTEAHPLVDA